MTVGRFVADGECRGFHELQPVRLQVIDWAHGRPRRRRKLSDGDFGIGGKCPGGMVSVAWPEAAVNSPPLPAIMNRAVLRVLEFCAAAGAGNSAAS